jgi:hypothetical protein
MLAMNLFDPRATAAPDLSLGGLTKIEGLISIMAKSFDGHIESTK